MLVMDKHVYWSVTWCTFRGSHALFSLRETPSKEVCKIMKRLHKLGLSTPSGKLRFIRLRLPIYTWKVLLVEGDRGRETKYITLSSQSRCMLLWSPPWGIVLQHVMGSPGMNNHQNHLQWILSQTWGSLYLCKNYIFSIVWRTIMLEVK